VTRAIILAAGAGRRLGGTADEPKVLLDFEGKSLLERHLAALRRHGIGEIALTVGYRSEAIRNALSRLPKPPQVTLVDNPEYRLGSMVSLWCQRAWLRSGDTVLVMDGDVLYEQAVLGRLIASRAENALLVDRHIEPGDEPVKVCFRAGVIVDFRKRPVNPHDWHGESVGFFRFSPAMAADLAARCSWYVERGEKSLEYEEAIRDLILAHPQRFAAEDVSGLAWTEIDFQEDVRHARDDVLPHIQAEDP
jgi:choline kinase